MGMYDVESGKTAKLKAYDVESGKLDKLKKAYVVENGKLVKLWSGFEPRFIGASHYRLYKSVDGTKWDVSNVPWETSYLSSSFGKNADHLGMTFGLGRYWLANGKYLCCSDDGDTWTIARTGTTNSVDGKYGSNQGFTKVFFVNGQICAYEALEKKLYITSDGTNWSSVNTDSGYVLRELLYGTYNGKKVYVWCYHNNSNTTTIYTSSALNGTLTSVKSYYAASGWTVKACQALVRNGSLIVAAGSNSQQIVGYTTPDRPTTFYSAEYLTTDYPFLLGSSDYEVIYWYDTGKVRSAGSFTTSSVTETIYEPAISTSNGGMANMHPPYNPSGMVAFPMALSGAGVAFYKPKGSTAFTKVTGVGSVTNGSEPRVAVYGVDGGGYYTN